jgi:hypothetical protein
MKGSWKITEQFHPSLIKGIYILWHTELHWLRECQNSLCTESIIYMK